MAWAQTLFFCLQQETEAWGEKMSMVYLVSSLFFVTCLDKGPMWVKKSNLNLSFSENQLIPAGKVTLTVFTITPAGAVYELGITSVW